MKITISTEAPYSASELIGKVSKAMTLYKGDPRGLVCYYKDEEHKQLSRQVCFEILKSGTLRIWLTEFDGGRPNEN